MRTFDHLDDDMPVTGNNTLTVGLVALVGYALLCSLLVVMI